MPSSSQLDPDPWNVSLVDTDLFTVVPSLGAIVPGWLLVVPKGHTICAGAMAQDHRSELEVVVHNAAEAMRAEFGRVIIFEHGPSQTGQQLGCSIDHTHIHLVPSLLDIKQAIFELYDGNIVWSKVPNMGATADAYSKGIPYLYLEQDESCYMATGASLRSQTLRRIIALYAGAIEFDWKIDAQMDNVYSTINRLKGLTFFNPVHCSMQTIS